MCKPPKILLILSIVFAFCQVNAQDAGYTAYKRLITQADGLPDRNVLCGMQDKYGFLWLGTRSGLCRYDGSKFIFLTRKSSGLRGTSVLSLAADDSIGIIITYTDPGFSIYPDRVRDVVNIKTLEVKPLAFYYPSIPFKEGDIDRIVYKEAKPLGFLLKNNNSYWAYSHTSGFQKKRLKGKPIRAILPGIEKWNALQIKQLNERLSRDLILEEDSTLHTFKREYLTLTCLKNGFLLYYDDLHHPNHTLPYFLRFDGVLLPQGAAGKTEQALDSYEVGSWRSGYYYSLHSISPSGIGGGSVMQLTDGSVVLYVADTGLIPLFRKEENIHVESFFRDRQGACWLCTNVGLYKITIKKQLFRRYFTRDQKRFAFNNSARGIYADEHLLSCSLYDATVVLQGQDTLLLPGSQNFAIARVDSALWLGGWYLRIFDLRTRKMPFTIFPEKAEIWSVFPVSHNRLFLGCTGGIMMCDIATHQVSEISYSRFPRPKFIYKIFRTTNGEIMAVAENGLYVLSDAGMVTDCYSASAIAKNRQLPCNTIYDVYEDRDGMYWIASNLEGLFKWDRRRHQFRQFGIENGFLSTLICGIQEDDYDNLWLSTDFGLARFNKKTAIAKTYTENDGISNNEFNRSSVFKDKTGRIFFGGMNGLTSFDPKDFYQEAAPQKYPFALLGFYRFNGATGGLENNTAEVMANHKIALYEANRFSTISFSLLDYESREHRYAYMVEGLDQNWSYISEDHIRLGDLPYGDYHLRIKAQLADGNWNEQEIVIGLQVARPFYKTGWFILFCVLLGAGLVVFFFKIRIRMLNNKNKKLEMVVNQRTAALKTALDEQKAMLQEIHHRVKNNLQFIQAMIDMQVSASKHETDRMALKDTTRRINAMTLVHEMLYNRDKLEAISIKEYIGELVEKLWEMVNDQQPAIRVILDIEEVHFNINNCLALGMITTEVVSNSIRHAFGKTPSPEISIRLQREPDIEKIIYTIKDNGTGFDENRLEAGLGMRLIDIFTRQLKGAYSMKNQQGFLFIFEFKWPLP